MSTIYLIDLVPRRKKPFVHASNVSVVTMFVLGWWCAALILRVNGHVFDRLSTTLEGNVNKE